MELSNDFKSALDILFIITQMEHWQMLLMIKNCLKT